MQFISDSFLATRTHGWAKHHTIIYKYTYMRCTCIQIFSLLVSSDWSKAFKTLLSFVNSLGLAPQLRVSLSRLEAASLLAGALNTRSPLVSHWGWHLSNLLPTPPARPSSVNAEQDSVSRLRLYIPGSDEFSRCGSGEARVSGCK